VPAAGRLIGHDRRREGIGFPALRPTISHASRYSLGLYSGNPVSWIFVMKPWSSRSQAPWKIRHKSISVKPVFSSVFRAESGRHT